MKIDFQINGQIECASMDEATEYMESLWDHIDGSNGAIVHAYFLDEGENIEDDDDEADLGSDQLHGGLDHQPAGNV